MKDFWLQMISALPGQEHCFETWNCLGFPIFFVSNEKPEKMVKNFPEFFHKIILDAPCSGEGMFRKEEALAKDWTPKKSEELSEFRNSFV